MGDEDHGLLRLRPQLQQFFIKVVTDDLIERTKRLVHQKQVGIKRERAGDGGALLHSAGQLPWKLFLKT